MQKLGQKYTIYWEAIEICYQITSYASNMLVIYQVFNFNEIVLCIVVVGLFDISRCSCTFVG